MKTNFQMVQEFHQTFECLRNDTPVILELADWNLRVKLMEEELAEVRKAYANQDRINIAKELADLLYVVYGTADSCGIDIDKVFEEVHKSNMSKLDKDGKVLRREDGKVLKSELYREPDLTWL